MLKDFFLLIGWFLLWTFPGYLLEMLIKKRVESEFLTYILRVTYWLFVIALTLTHMTGK